MTDERFRRELTRALDEKCAQLTPTERQKQRLYENITGGIGMKRKARLSLGLVLALILALLAIGAAAAALLSAREVIEQNAVPMAMNNDTESRKTESYSHDQLVALVRAANENGITLDESTGIMRALRQGIGYWEDEAIMEICREAFGGLIDEWTVEEKYWYASLQAEMFGYELEMDHPGPDDLTAEEARKNADGAVRAAYPGARDVGDPACYKRLEDFSRTEENGKKEGVWSFTYKPLDMTHARYTVSVNAAGAILEMDETPQDWSRYTVSDLERGINENYRSATYTRYSWSQEAWHTYREMLPGASRDANWRMEHDAYLLCGYPLPDEGDIAFQAAREIALQDAGMTEADLGTYEKVLLSDQTGRHIWKVSFARPQQDQMTSWEIDAKTGEILMRREGQAGDMRWQCYVPSAVYSQATKNLLSGEEAARIAADALREYLGEKDIPYEDAELFERRVNFSDWNQSWQITFKTKTEAYATGAVRITEPEHTAEVTNASPSRVDGDSLWGRYKQVFGASRWTQEIWVRFGREMAAFTPTGWEGKLLKNTRYPEANSVKMTRERAVDIAFAHNDWQEEGELDATLISAQPHPVWKVALSGQECIWLYEIDTETGEVLDKEKYSPDNYDFDPPVKRYTLHRDFAPAFAEAFGAERLAVIEISKTFGDMSYDDPIATVLGPDIDSESVSTDEIMPYTAQTEGHTVTIRPAAPGIPAYRVTFSEGWMTENVEKLTGE